MSLSPNIENLYKLGLTAVFVRLALTTRSYDPLSRPKNLSRIPRLARQDLAAGFAGALPGLRLAPHIVKHTRGATQTSAHVENHTTHKEEGGVRCGRANNHTAGAGGGGGTRREPGPRFQHESPRFTECNPS